MKTTIFLEDRWVKFTLNGITCIGYTYAVGGTAIDKPLHLLVYCISKMRKPKTVDFRKCLDVNYLEFIKKPSNNADLVINKVALPLDAQIDLLIRPVISRKTITTLAKNQRNQLFMN